jgi:hypothetical protein
MPAIKAPKTKATVPAVPLVPYYASDRRCYNGAFCSDLQREADRTDALEKRMKESDPSATCTYFPAEGKYMVFVDKKIQSGPFKGNKSPRELTGNFYRHKQQALIEAIQVLEGI